MVYKCRVPRITDDTFLARKKGIVRVGGEGLISILISIETREIAVFFFPLYFAIGIPSWGVLKIEIALIDHSLKWSKFIRRYKSCKIIYYHVFNDKL